MWNENAIDGRDKLKEISHEIEILEERRNGRT